jgi:carbon monoxide dehydrogenase subunit G
MAATTSGTLTTKHGAREVHRSTGKGAGTTFATIASDEVKVESSIKADGETRVAWYRRVSGGWALVKEVALTPGFVER